jgi:hypothetical protein
MFIFWKDKIGTVNLGTIDSRHCEHCGTERPFNAHLAYRSRLFYGLFGYIEGRQYQCLCNVCQRGWVMETHEAGALGDDPPIPFLHRHGAVLAFGVLLAFMAVAGVLLLLGYE